MNYKVFFLVFFMTAIGASAQQSYDFSAMTSSGHTLYYKIESSNTVSVVNPDIFGYVSGNLTIPSTVVNNSVTYTVTTIGEAAFAGCYMLDTVTIPSSVDSIGARAFYCARLSTVYMNMLTPPYENPDENIFLGNPLTFYVPCSVASAYALWRHREQVIGYGESTPEVIYDTIDACGYFDYEGNELLFVSFQYWNAIIDSAGEHEFNNIFGCSGLTLDLSVVESPGYSVLNGYIGIVPSYFYQYIIDSISRIGWFFDDCIGTGRAEEFTTSHGCDSSIFYDTLLFSSDDYNPQICMVSYEDGHNKVIWSSVEDKIEDKMFDYFERYGEEMYNWDTIHHVVEYRIYREGSVANQFDLVATSPGGTTSWRDDSSHPGNRSYRYRISSVMAFDTVYGMAIDEYESPMSPIHKTSHLTINKGQGNNWNLLWTEYEGTEFVTYIIYRGTNQYDLVEIERLPVGINTTYTDSDAPEGDVYYQVGIVPAEPCTSSGAKSTDVILTNIATNGVLRIDNAEMDGISAYATNGRIYVNVEGSVVDGFHVYDLMGREVFHATHTNVTPVLPGGVYMVKVDGLPARRVVVIR